MEFGSASRSKCLSYDVDQARLVLLQDGERHEISIRAQGHRLVRYMAERNEAGGGPALCTHEELMQAVWADEPMHSREELAKLFWELRKSKCLSYDVDQARLVLLQDGERHEISIRAQGHRLVRYMAERNEAGGGPALCTHEELMQAVWADEPMHSREELAKLFWELRKK